MSQSALSEVEGTTFADLPAEARLDEAGRLDAADLPTVGGRPLVAEVQAIDVHRHEVFLQIAVALDSGETGPPIGGIHRTAINTPARHTVGVILHRQGAGVRLARDDETDRTALHQGATGHQSAEVVARARTVLFRPALLPTDVVALALPLAPAPTPPPVLVTRRGRPEVR